MKVTSKIDFGSIEKRLESAAENAIRECMDVAHEELKKYTPEDYGDLNAAWKKGQVQNSGTKITGSITNDTPYGKFVNDGVGGREYKYYKNGGRRKGGSPFHRGVGAHMLKKTQDYNMAKFRTIFLSNIQGRR